MTGTNSAPARVARAVSPILTTADAVDTASFARPQIARVTHVALDLDLDFATRRVGGTATLDGVDLRQLDPADLRRRHRPV